MTFGDRPLRTDGGQAASRFGSPAELAEHRSVVRLPIAHAAGHVLLHQPKRPL